MTFISCSCGAEKARNQTQIFILGLAELTTQVELLDSKGIFKWGHWFRKDGILCVWNGDMWEDRDEDGAGNAEALDSEESSLPVEVNFPPPHRSSFPTSSDVVPYIP